MTAVKQDTSVPRVEQQVPLFSYLPFFSQTPGTRLTAHRHSKTYTSTSPLPTTPKRTETRASQRQRTRNCSDVPELPSPRARPHRHHRKKKHARGDSEVTVGSALSVPPSPLESTAVIRPMIPPRTSSLRNAGARRFRLPSLAPSFTLATLPSLPSIISFGRRQRQRRKESKGKGKEKEEKEKGGGAAVAVKEEDEDEWVECDDNEAAGTTTMTTATTESEVFGGVGGAGVPMPLSKLGMGHATGNTDASAGANGNANANTPRLGSPSKHRARAHHPTGPMPSSAMATRFPPRHDSLSSISLRRVDIAPASGGLAATTTAATREVASSANNNINSNADDGTHGEGPQSLPRYHKAPAGPGFSLGGAFGEDGSNNSWRMTSAGSVSVEASSTFSSELPALARAKTRESRPRSALVSAASAPTERAREARASLEMSLLPHPPCPSSSSPQEPRQPVMRSARSPVSPSIPIPTPMPVPVALAFRPARRRVLVRGDHGSEAPESHNANTAAAGGASAGSTETEGGGWQADGDGDHDHDPRPSYTMDLLERESDGGTPTRTLFPANGAPYIFAGGINPDANANRNSQSSSTSMHRGRGGGGDSSPLLRTQASFGEEASSEASTEVEFGMAVTGRLLRPSVIASGTETEGGFAPQQQ